MAKVSALKLGILHSQLAQKNYIDKRVEQQVRRRRRSQYQGFYQGYDANKAMHSVKLDDGSTLYTKSISDRGRLTGRQVSVNRPRGLEYGFMK